MRLSFLLAMWSGSDERADGLRLHGQRPHLLGQCQESAGTADKRPRKRYLDWGMAGEVAPKPLLI